MCTKRIMLVLPFVTLSGIIFWLSSIPGLTPPDLGFSWQDKLYHTAAFFVYGCCTVLAVLSVRTALPTGVRLILVLVIGISFSVSDELHQVYVPNRFAGIDDVLADCIGVCLSLFTFRFFKHRINLFLARSG